MSHRGRTTYAYESDDDSSIYDTVLTAPAPRRKSRSRSRVIVVDEKHDGPPVRLRAPRMKAQQHYSYSDATSAYGGEPENLTINNLLTVPSQRPRASSTGGAPQPQLIYVQSPEREVSQTRIKHYREKRRESSSSSDDRSSRNRRRSRRRTSGRDDEYISPETAERLARLKLLEEQQLREQQMRYNNFTNAGSKVQTGYVDPATAERLARLKILEEEQQRRADQERERRIREQMDPAIAEKLARLKILEEESKKPHISPEMADKLARLKAIEEKKIREEEEAAFLARIEDKKRKEKEREERMMLEFDDARRKESQAQKDAIAKAEAASAKAKAEAKAEREHILAEAKAQAAADKAEKERIVAMERARMEKEKKEADEERKRIVAEEKAKAEKAKKEAEEARKRIIAEEEERRKKEKAEWEETKLRVLAEKKKEEEEAKAKKKAEDEAFNNKVKERFMKEGFSPDYIEDILEEKKREGRKVSTSRASANTLALEMARPTYIRVQIRHLLPETLEYYGLPWEHDPTDNKYLLIKEYISHDFQQELFNHTKRIYKQRETRLITDGYTKETVTTLRPNLYKDKDKDEMFMVRRKSQGKSPSRPGRGWMFT